jgi:two-component system sporulation sensor kinase A
MASDITERKKAIAALKESEERYRALVNWSPIPIVVHRNGVFVYVNPATIKMFGASSELELIGKSVLDFSHPDSTPLIKNRIQQMAINNAILPIIEERFIKLDGSSTIDVEVQSLPIKYKGEDAYIVVAHDITERKKMETALHESEERYRSIVECSPDGIGVHRDGKILFVNTAGVKMYGAIAAEDMMGKFINDIIHKDSQQTSVERIGLINEGQDFLPIATLKLLRIDGTMLDVEVQSSSIVYDGGPAVQTTIRDITKRKQEEQQLRLLESVVTNTNDAILITEAHPVEMPGPRIVYVSGRQNPQIITGSKV